MTLFIFIFTLVVFMLLLLAPKPDESLFMKAVRKVTSTWLISVFAGATILFATMVTIGPGFKWGDAIPVWVMVLIFAGVFSLPVPVMLSAIYYYGIKRIGNPVQRFGVFLFTCYVLSFIDITCVISGGFEFNPFDADFFKLFLPFIAANTLAVVIAEKPLRSGVVSSKS